MKKGYTKFFWPDIRQTKPDIGYQKRPDIWCNPSKHGFSCFRGNLWANDESKFGKKLMEKMGWEAGKVYIEYFIFV